MTIEQFSHAQKVANHFKEIIEDNGDSISDEHIEELVLLIESAIDAALLDKVEKHADKVAALAKEIRNDVEHYEKGS
jgi:hypothetical protein